METFHIAKAVLDGERARYGYSLGDLAAECKTPISTIHKCWAAGCSSKTIIPIANALRLKPWWKILVETERRSFENPDPHSATETQPLFMFYRSTNLSEDYFSRAFASGKRVIYLTIMSKRTLKTLGPLLTPNTQLNVLTWMPATDAEVKGFAKHINEGDDKIEQVIGALRGWDKLAKRHKNISVYTYSSSPTMMGVVVEGLWAHIEMIPYDTRPTSRPALLLRDARENEQQAFRFFADRFEALLQSSKRRRPGEMPEWYRT